MVRHETTYLLALTVEERRACDAGGDSRVELPKRLQVTLVLCRCFVCGCTKIFEILYLSQHRKTPLQGGAVAHDETAQPLRPAFGVERAHRCGSDMVVNRLC